MHNAAHLLGEPQGIEKQIWGAQGKGPAWVPQDIEKRTWQALRQCPAGTPRKGAHPLP